MNQGDWLGFFWRLFKEGRASISMTGYPRCRVCLELGSWGGLIYIIPVEITLNPVNIKQYSIFQEGLKPIINQFLEYSLIKKGKSPSASKFCQLKKHDGSFHLVLHLPIISSLTMTIHLTVPNLYILMSLFSSAFAWFTVLEFLKKFFPVFPFNALVTSCLLFNRQNGLLKIYRKKRSWLWQQNISFNYRCGYRSCI